MGKNIVLLADGTGNSESSAFKTNVRRLYEAVDTQPPKPGESAQVAFYDNGVGTETFKPLQVLGLAFGIGVARNVKNLYTFLCRNYNEGDNIYLFGFSRGAFTVRVLAGLILRCGVVVDWKSDAELAQSVKLAYAEYKRDVARRATKTRPWLLAGQLLGGKEAGEIEGIDFGFEQKYPRISFIGVWDTVDAYGMPIDELKEGIDRYVWPMTLADRHFSDHVDRACHALSLDDERPTFRPVLWTDPANKPERLSQVWFAGVHANVGGGYPDDSLACVSLQWMMDEAHACGLRFYQNKRDEYDQRADPHGKQYDSRSGVGGYYRYGPRDMSSLCHDRDHKVTVARPQVHASVLERIHDSQVAYTPSCITHSSSGYDLLARADAAARAKGSPVLTPVSPVESASDLKARAEAMELVYDAIFRRRFAYLCTVVFTAVLVWLPIHDWLVANVWRVIAKPFEETAPKLFALVAAPFSAVVWIGEKLAEIPGWNAASRAIAAALNWILGLGFLPGWAAFWVESFARHPALFLFCALLVAWLFLRKSQLIQEQVCARTYYAWSHVKRGSGSKAAKPASGWMDPIVRRLRTNRFIAALYRGYSRHVLPFLFAVFVVAPIGLLILPFFIPKFVRNLYRRNKYKVKHLKTGIKRVAGSHPRGARAA
jgi:uncharacterized protein (DUF2235 family)